MLIFITSHFPFVMLQSIYLHLAVKIFFSSFSVTSSYLLIKISTCANEHIIKIDKISVIIFFLKIYCISHDNSETDTNCFQSREHFPFVLWVLIDLLAVFCCEEAGWLAYLPVLPAQQAVQRLGRVLRCCGGAVTASDDSWTPSEEHIWVSLTSGI